MGLLLSLLFLISPPTNVKAIDTPNDAGKTISVTWKLSKDDSLLSGYEIWRSEYPDTGYKFLSYIGRGIGKFTDRKGIKDGVTYYYKLKARSKTHEISTLSGYGYASSSPQWYHKGKTNVLIVVIIYTAILLFFISRAKRGKKLFIRKIAGLEALDEAVGRATEMGRPLLYIPGISSITDIATIASMNILGQVAKKTAGYGTPLIVPNYDPIVMTVAQEVVKQGCTEAGRPDVYNKENIFFLSNAQFAYAAGVDGIMMREKPATNMFIGMFFAESLLLSESGNMVGAVQIAGTDAVDQLPFFVVSCDYTIMGEELYAASAYLSKEPLLMGTIKGQDYGKLLLLGVIVAGTLFAFLGSHSIINFFNIP